MSQPSQTSSKRETMRCDQTPVMSHSNQYPPTPWLTPHPNVAQSYDLQQTDHRQMMNHSDGRTHDSSSHPAPRPTLHKRERKHSERDPPQIAKSVQREAAKQKANQFKEDRKQRLKEESDRKRWLGGVAWGFDPKAGMTSYDEPNEADGGCYVSAGRSLQGFQGADEIDELGRRTGRRWVSQSLWGIEHGGPGKEGKYGHGSLRDRVVKGAATFVKEPRGSCP